MDLLTLPYINLDPKKGYDYFQLAITTLRRDWRQIVNIQNAIYWRELLDGRQSIHNVIESFADKDFKKHANIKPLAIMSVFVNEMVENIKQSPPKVELRAEDPSSLDMKAKDIQLLKNRKILENDRSALQAKVGMPPYQLPTDSYKGNVQKFDEMGFNENDDDDINFFSQNYHELNYTIGGQQLINSILKLARFDKGMITKYVRDAMALNTICGDSYVDRITGEIKTEYIYPEEYFNIPSDTEDGADDICKGFQRSVTIGEFLRRVGSDFDWYNDWPYLIWAINYHNNSKYTGFLRNNIGYDCIGNVNLTGRAGVQEGWNSSLLDWSVAYRYKVYMGKIQWICPEATETYLKSKKDGSYVSGIPYNYPMKNKKMKAEYETESWYQFQLYESYFLATTSLSQYIFSYGKTYHQVLEGVNDEYCRWTLWHYQNQGKSISEIAEPYINLANFTFYRMLWAVYKAKPEEDQYMIEELLEISKGVQRLFPQVNTSNTQIKLDDILSQLIQFQREKSIRLRTYPKAEGRTIPQLASLKSERAGIDPVATAMQQIMQWAQQMIAIETGINSMRIGANPPSRESTKSEENTIENSERSTNYVYRMIQYMKEHLATTSTLYAQDIVRFKDSLPYDWILKLIGQEKTDAIGMLDDFAAHRYSIFVEDMSDIQLKQDIKAASSVALQQKTITYDQWFVINTTADVKRGWQLLSFLQRKQDKKIRKQAIQDQQIALQMEQAKHQMKMEEINATGNFELRKADITAKGVVAAAQIQSQGRINVKELQVESEIPKVQAKSDGQIQVDKEKKNLESQESFANP